MGIKYRKKSPKVHAIQHNIINKSNSVQILWYNNNLNNRRYFQEASLVEFERYFRLLHDATSIIYYSIVAYKLIQTHKMNWSTAISDLVSSFNYIAFPMVSGAYVPREISSDIRCFCQSPVHHPFRFNNHWECGMMYSMDVHGWRKWKTQGGEHE